MPCVTMRNYIHQNHTILQLKFKKKLIYNYFVINLWYYNYYATIPTRNTMC